MSAKAVSNTRVGQELRAGIVTRVPLRCVIVTCSSRWSECKYSMWRRLSITWCRPGTRSLNGRNLIVRLDCVGSHNGVLMNPVVQFRCFYFYFYFFLVREIFSVYTERTAHLLPRYQSPRIVTLICPEDKLNDKNMSDDFCTTNG